MKRLITICLLLTSIKTFAQQIDIKDHFRPATKEEMDILVSPELQESIKESAPRIETTVHENLIAKSLAKRYENDSQYFDKDVTHFLQKKVNEGANKGIIIQYANLLTSSYMSFISTKVQLENDIKAELLTEQNELTKKIEESLLQAHPMF